MQVICDYLYDNVIVYIHVLEAVCNRLWHCHL